MGHGVIANNTTTLRQVTRSLHAVFRNALELANGDFDTAMRFFMEATSTGDQEDYNWLGSIPAMEEWIDKRPHSSLSQFGQTIKNANYANGVKMPLDWMDDDKLGQMTPRIQGLANGYQLHVANQFLSLLESGTSDLCYDGLAFFSASHAEGDSGTQSNYDASGVTLTAANVESVRARMVELKDDKGNRMGIRPTHLWTSPAQLITAMEITTAKLGAAGIEQQTHKLGLDVIEVPGLATTTWWGLVDLGKPMKPFIKQNRRKVSFAAMDKIDDELVYNQREVRYGADYRGGYGYGFWQMMHMSVGA